MAKQYIYSDEDILSVAVGPEEATIWTDKEENHYFLSRKDVLQIMKEMRITKAELIKMGIT